MFDKQPSGKPTFGFLLSSTGDASGSCATLSETHLLGDLGGDPNRVEDDWTENDDDAAGQRLAKDEQQQPHTATQKVANAIEDLIPGDSDHDGH